MKNLFWRLIARTMASAPRLVERVIHIAQRTPYFHLQHANGSPYMSRWWLMPRWMLKHDEHGHLVPRAWVPVSFRLHHIHTADDGRDLHDHPFDYRTLLLRGWYVEQDIFGKNRWFRAGSTRAARAQTFHRITSVSVGGCWTLFIMGRRINRWGFLVGGRKVYYRDYFDHFTEKGIKP